jgi:hypothetical protein
MKRLANNQQYFKQWFDILRKNKNCDYVFEYNIWIFDNHGHTFEPSIWFLENHSDQP